MVAKNVEKSWKLPKANEEPVSDMVKGQPRPWWHHFFNNNIKSDPDKPKKCPICKIRMVMTKSSKGEFSCYECAHLHHRTIVQVDTEGRATLKSVYLSDREIIADIKRLKGQLAEARSPGKKNH